MEIREMVLNLNDVELEQTGLLGVSLVDEPAIQLGFMYFNEQTLEAQEVTCSHQDVLTDQMKDIILKFADENGETPDDSWEWINEAFFAEVDETNVLDILKSLQDKNVIAGGEVKYRYSGPPAERDFCQLLLSKNKLFTESEIAKLNDMNPGFGPKGSNTYDVRQFRGGISCKHFFTAVKVFRDANTGKTVAYDMGRMDWGPKNVGKYTFKAVEDEQIVVGPALIPNKLIRRYETIDLPNGTKQRKEYYVYFSVETIDKLAAKFLAQNKIHNTNINHDPTTNTNVNTLLSSWIVVDPNMDAAKAYGYDVPSGTWMASYKINDPITWKMVKQGKLSGFSIEGLLFEKKVDTSEEAKLWNELFNILGQVKD